MCAAVNGPWPDRRDNVRPEAFTFGVSGDVADGRTPDTARRSLQAQQSGWVYQAAGDQYIYERPPPTPCAVRNTLPRETAGFTGRDRELRALMESVREWTDRDAMIPVHAINGMPGVGKTAFTIHAGHRLAPQFPDGQFFISLHTHSGKQGPVRPEDALFALLCADGVDAAQIPAEPDARAALWRGRLAGRRVLLIIDDAPGRPQVEQLLPGAAGCLVLVTSRRRLTGLSAQHGAVILSLRTLPPEQARALFLRTAARPTGTEDEAVAELVRLCGFLPLAICLLAARLRAEPHWPVADLVEELKRAKHRLTQMRADDVAVAAAFDLSYRLLPAGRRRFFRRLGWHPGVDLDAFAAGALDAVPADRARQELDALYHDHLLDQPAWGRYRMHDLIAEYARGRTEGEPAIDRVLATGRLLDYYLRGVRLAEERLHPPGRRSPRWPGPVDPTGPVDRFGPPTRNGANRYPHLPELPHLRNRAQASAWLAAERTNLLACVALVPSYGEPTRTIAFSVAMASYLRNNGPWESALGLHAAAAAAARQLGDRSATASALLELGAVQQAMGTYQVAEKTLSDSLALFRRLDQGNGIADALTHLAGVHWRVSNHASAADELTEALTRYDELGDLCGQADALDELGVVRNRMKDQHGSVEAFERALLLHRELGDSQGEGNTLNRLGLARQLTGEYSAAIEAHEQALAVYRELGDRFGQARALNGLGGARCEIGDYDDADRALREALMIHRDLGYHMGQAIALFYLGVVRRHVGDLPEAEQVLRQALTCYRELDYRLGQADALNQLGVLARLRGDLGSAETAHEQSLAMFQALDNDLGQAEVRNMLGELLLTRGEPEQAMEQHRQALQAAGAAHNVLEQAHSIAGMGQCALGMEDHATALKHLRKAEAQYRRIGAAHAARQMADLVRQTCPSDTPVRGRRAA